MIRFLIVSLAWLPLAFTGYLTSCPILGPVFPTPRTLSTSVLQGVFKNLTGTLNRAVATGNSTHGVVNNDTSYTIQFFSLDEAEPAFEWYYTSPSIRNGSFGTKEVDGDSIFRIGSVTKLFTVYAMLTELGDIYWDQPVTNSLPELLNQAQKSHSDPINFLDWTDVTLGALASHLTGVTRDLASLGGLSVEFPQALLTEYGLPPLTRSKLPPCLQNTTTPCNRSEFLAALSTRQPVYAPNTTPIYSNTGFQILAYALESATGRPFLEVLNDRIITPLSLLSTYTKAPANYSRGVIPQDPGSSGWNYNRGEAMGYSGIYTTTSDLVKLGKSILNSTLLDTNITRGWLKPVTHTSSLTLAVGRPWEIARQALDPPYEHVTDIYTKSGDENKYSSLIALLPDYNAGFVTLAAGPGQCTVIDEIILDAIVPNMEVAAREQAQNVFGGTYSASELDSSITLSTNPDLPGLQITKWISNGTDAFDAFVAIYGDGANNMTVVLQPTNLESTVASGVNGTVNASSASDQSAREIAFRAIYEIPSTFTDTGVVAEGCTSWISMDAVNYGDFAVDQFLITVGMDESGQEKVQSIRPRFLHVTLEREE